MRWRGGRRSENIEDQRGQTPQYAGAGAGGVMLLRLLPLLFRSKIGRIILIAGVVIVLGGKLLGIDLLPMLTGSTATVQTQRELTESEQQLADFTSVVLADTEDTWRSIFAERGGNYREPTLVLFSGQVQSACGFASAAVGPFYCPGDQKVYLDLSFFDDLARRFGAPGDFAQAYVIAHEVGHHVQTLLGISQEVRQAGAGRSKEEINALSVRQELQADCFSGVWGHIAHRDRQILEPGDLDEALKAASAIGDDRLQRQAGGQVIPDSFTHGTSEQRARWFRKGFETGDIEACNTFEARNL